MIKSKMMQQSDQPAGFRIKPDGELELMTDAEVHAAVARALNDALKQFRPIAMLH
jgi:hypothetical protein